MNKSRPLNKDFDLVSNDVPIFKARLSIYAYMRSYTTIMTKTHFAIFILYVYKHVYNVCMYVCIYIHIQYIVIYILIYNCIYIYIDRCIYIYIYIYRYIILLVIAQLQHGYTAKSYPVST